MGGASLPTAIAAVRLASHVETWRSMGGASPLAPQLRSAVAPPPPSPWPACPGPLPPSPGVTAPGRRGRGKELCRGLCGSPGASSAVAVGALAAPLGRGLQGQTGGSAALSAGPRPRASRLGLLLGKAGCFSVRFSPCRHQSRGGDAAGGDAARPRRGGQEEAHHWPKAAAQEPGRAVRREEKAAKTRHKIMDSKLVMAQ